jgi:MSHA biogenesis protein MshQ
LSTSCDINFSDSTFLISAVPTQLAGVTSGNITVRAVEKNTTTGACQGKFNGPVDIEVNARCINPTTCAGKSMVIGCTGACTSTAVSTTDNAATSTYTTVQKVNFGGTSTATLTVNYPDVGQMDFTLRYSLGGGQYMTGTSNAFVVMPYDYTVTNIKRTSDNVANPAAASASGTKFVQAGDGTTSTNQFTATVTAIASGGAATPNFGKEISQEGIKLTSARILDADLVNNGTFYVGSSASGQIAQLNLFSGGAATRTNLAWSEVGIMTLTPSIADGDYLGAGDKSGTASGNIGRFYPAQFTQVSGSVTAACAGGGFTYMGQKFTLASTLEARNSLASKTLNYNGTYAKSTVSYAAENADNGTDLMSRLGVSPGGSWLQGTFTLSGSTSTFSRPASPDGPFDSLLLGVKVTDPDGPVLSSLDMNPAAVGSAAPTHRLISGTATKMRFGRMRLSNAIGSELLRARVEYRAEYWDGSRWLTNTIDTCSGIAANNVAITTAGPAVYGTPTFNNGVGFITFNTPGSAGSYSYDIAVNLGATSGDASCNAAGFPAATAGANMPWLRGYWSGSCGGIAAWAQDPSARIKLGSPKAPYIYLRERY